MIDEKVLQNLRACVKDSKWPLVLDEYPHIHVNCLAFALGLTVPDPGENIYGYLGCISGIAQYNIEIGFTRDCEVLGIHCRKISSEEECLEGEHLVKVYGFYFIHGPGYTYRDFHVIRRQSDGTWIHKLEYGEPCEVITDWDAFHKEYPESDAHLFAIRKEEP